MRVLLISPLPGLDPPCGDITYTQVLLENAPPGVSYETYDTAFRRGALIEHARRQRLYSEPALTVTNKVLNLARSAGLLFSEPFRFFSVRQGEFDLVHMHVFQAAFLELDCPLVVSCGAPQQDLYMDRRGYSRLRTDMTDRFERAVGKMLTVNRNSGFMPQAQRVQVYTQYYKDFLSDRGFMTRDAIDVIPIMLRRDAAVREERVPRRVGFVARNFVEKGGPVVLAAFERVRSARPDAELWIVGSPPEMSEAEQSRRGVRWLPVVERDVLLREVMPGFDVFAYPTPHDCFSYVMLEAMSCGCAIATSDYVSMPEAVDFGKAGLISKVGDAAGLAGNILELLDPETNWRLGRAARRRFEEHFSTASVVPRLKASYEAAIRGFGPNGRGRAMEGAA